MNLNNFTYKHFSISLLVILSLNVARAQNNKDTLHLKEPRHYFQPTFYLNFYSTPKRDIKLYNVTNHSRTVRRKFGATEDYKYQFTQTNLGFFTPLYTKDKKKDDGSIANTHVLLTGTLLTANPYLNALNSNHVIYRGSLGARTIVNTGGKNIWFFDVFGFASEDNKSMKMPTPRLGATVILNRTVSEDFSYRIGLTRTFLFGSKLYLPILGFRFGRLDEVNLTIQLPKNISLNIPVSSNSGMSLYFKPFGGIYNFKNTDSLFSRRASVIQFRRLDYLLGASYSYCAGDHFSFFASSGIAAGGFAFADDKYSPTNTQPFLKIKASPSLFINAGITLKIGKAKRADNDIRMMDIKDLNTTNDPGDVNAGTGENQSKKKPKDATVKNLKYKDIEDLITETDLQ